MAEPKVRFKRDDGSDYPAWQESLIGRECSFINGKAHENCEDDNGRYIIVNSKYISSDGKVFRKTNSLLEPLYENDIVMVMSDVPNGKAMSKCMVVHTSNNFTLNQRICCLRSSNNSVFIASQISRCKYFLSFDDGVKQTNLRKQDILDCPVFIASMEEQQKIADFLSSVDAVISTSEQEVANLETQKKAVMKKFFSQEVRFKRLDGSDFPDWKERTVSDCLVYEQPGKYIVHSDEYDDSFNTPVLTANKGFILGYTDETDGHYTKGDVIIYDDFTMDMKYVSFEFKVKSSAIKMLTPKRNDIDLYFMYGLLLSKDLHQETHTRSYISVVEPMLIDIPCLEEQRLIADFLSDFDEAIAAAKKELELWKKLKKGLLQQMFV